jgi:hypothetical protein
MVGNDVVEDGGDGDLSLFSWSIGLSEWLLL